jgi:hypothetical protein
MNQTVLPAVTIVVLLLGGIVAIALIQNTEASTINTTRSNIKNAAKKMDVKGNKNQLSSQDSIVKQTSVVDNNCGDGADCPVVATNTMGDIQSPKSEVSLDTSISVDGDSNLFAATDPIPGVDVKLGQSIR